MPYRIEYATTGRASCNGPKPCAGTKIGKGNLRVGVLTEIQGHTMANLRSLYVYLLSQDGYEELSKEDQASVDAAYKLDRLREEDITPCLREKEDQWRKKDEEKHSSQEASHHTKSSKASTKKSNHALKNQDDSDDDIEPPTENLPAKRLRKKPTRYETAPQKRRRVKKQDADSHDEDDASSDADDSEESDVSNSSDAFDASEDDEDDDDEPT
ncbi:hypothetical protein MYAM1_003954 [Malassezia yamatoensis]|uniref:PARP-type domain-containing protein n=1 Tax=Malassezia yamatoensis TaxID=253288 RepID=A0AAJ5YWV4_9BASI|nr:hypothetical protein MYAM1_003954 [Malassezia yamatoensis]